MKNTVMLAVLCGSLAGFAAPTTIVDFTRPNHGWAATHQAKDMANRPEGYTFTVDGDDPWILSPSVTVAVPPPETRRLVFTLTCEPTTSHYPWQLFYVFGAGNYNECDSCQLHPVGKPPYTRFEAEISSEKFRNPCHFRLDPPGTPGSNFTIKSIRMDHLAPLWSYQPTPAAPLVIPASTPLVLQGRDWELRHDPDRIGAFRFLARGKTVENLPHEPFVYRDRSGKVQTLDWERTPMKADLANGILTTTATGKDADGRDWRLTRTFKPSSDRNSLEIRTSIKVLASTPAEALHLPALTLFVDRHSQGHKRQAMLAGVEYLEDEPSSNELELRIPEHNRLIPAPHCISAPLAVFTDSQHWLAAEWGQSPFATVFDTPDRQFHSGGHLLGFWAPAVGPCRHQSEYHIYKSMPVQEVAIAVTLNAGDGASVAEALEQRVKHLPEPDHIDATHTLGLLARGWLDSQIREGVKVKHAVGGSFHANVVADAPYLMKYLAAVIPPGTEEAQLAPRLRAVAAEMLQAVPPAQIGHSGVSHIRRPAPALLGGDLKAWLAAKAAEQRELNRHLASGKCIWQRPPNSISDLGSTLGANHCNGYTSMAFDSLVKAAVWSGDEAEIAKTAAVADKIIELYHGTVPRGAQPWEMPLHCPDIMASTHFVQAFAHLYRLKRDPKYLQEARHWAYSGLSMVYLDETPWKPEGKVGTYATCAVMGATQWVAPNWIGRPVQWCGLVYSAALWDLARVETDPGRAAFWRRIASGITRSGARQSHTDPDYIGLLPDSWNLVKQNQFPIPINPGTVEENLAEDIGKPFYTLCSLDDTALLHVPGAAAEMKPQNGIRQCRIAGWSEEPFKVVATRVDPPKSVTFNDQPIAFEYDAAHRALIVTLPARARGVLKLGR